jgi:hypothetical protein
MPNMFSNYENIPDMYIPSNRPTCPPPEKCCPNLDPCKPTRPYYADYDIEGNLVGYWWYYGNTLNLEFTIDGEITVEGSSEYVPMKPTKLDDGKISNYMEGKVVTMNLYNFRRELIYTKPIIATSNVVTFEIDEELSKQLVRGIYYCSLNVSDEKLGLDQTVLQMEDCVLNVK